VVSNKELKTDTIEIQQENIEKNISQEIEKSSKMSSKIVSSENNSQKETTVSSTLEKLNSHKSITITDKKVEESINKLDVLVDKPLAIEDQEGTSLLDKIVASIQKAQKKDFIDEVEFRVEEKNLDAAVLSKSGVFYKESIKDLEPKELILMNKYVAEQKKQKDLTAQSAIESAKKVLSEEKGTESIKKAAKILELNPGEVVKEEIQKEEGIKVSSETPRANSFNKDVQNILHRAYLKENIADKQNEQEVIQKNTKIETEQNEKTLVDDKTKDIKNVEVNCKEVQLKYLHQK
jgi:hypothetical protein